jgi:RNA methyltransferase, TrmH family
MIESLHSPHIARVKALISSRGNKERGEHGQFIAEGLQCLREALAASSGPKIKTIFLTESGQSRIAGAGLDSSNVETILVSEPVMAAMSSTITPQGILSVCEIGRNSFTELKLTGKSKFIYLHEIQDPGNAGTILRSADAMGIDAVITSPGSVDMYSPKVVRATAGSLWHIDLYSGITLSAISEKFPTITKLALSAQGSTSLLDLKNIEDCIAIFGNEARGIDTLISGEVITVNIPMKGNAESLNLSAAAAIVMFHLTAS